MHIDQVQCPDTRAAICSAVLRGLPEWFGIEESTAGYVESSRTMPLWAAYDGDTAVGFVALKEHNAYAAEVYVMGIDEARHRQGIGRQLIDACEAHCRAHGIEYLTVKTLAETAESEEYARTRRFYMAMGFRPLEVFPLLWDPSNPCLFMAKYLR